MTHHKKAARLIRDLAAQLELLAAKVQDQVDDSHRPRSHVALLEGAP